MAPTILTFAMSVIKLLITLCAELEHLMNSFWWGQKDNERKIHWVGWDKVCRSKFKGGLDFKKLSTFNLALLVKQGWRFIQNEDSLLHCVFKVKCFPSSHLYDAKLGQNPSNAWRWIWEAKKYLFRGYRWSIGYRSRVRKWQDSRISKVFPLPVHQETLGLDPQQATVSLLMDSNSS